MALKVGKAKYGGGKKTYFKLKDGDSVFRILPPLGDLADDGFWSVYYRVHYGYTNAAGKSRPFESSLVVNRKNNMTEAPDAAVERLNKLKAELDNAKKTGNKKAVEAIHKLVGAPKSRYNLDNNHYLNAIDLQGNIGILKLRHKAKQQLDTAIRKLRDKGVDPLDINNGRYFVFTRTGMGNETQFSVTVYTQTQNIDGVGEVERQVVSALSEDIMSRLESEAAELNKLFKKPTSEEVAQIVSESNLSTGVSPNIDAILGYRTDNSASTGSSNEGEGDDYSDAVDAEVEETAEPQQTAPAQAAAPAQAPSTTTVAEKVTEKVAAKVENKKAAPSAPQTTAEQLNEMSPDEFLKSLGLE